MRPALDDSEAGGAATFPRRDRRTEPAGRFFFFFGVVAGMAAGSGRQTEGTAKRQGSKALTLAGAFLTAAAQRSARMRLTTFRVTRPGSTSSFGTSAEHSKIFTDKRRQCARRASAGHWAGARQKCRPARRPSGARTQIWCLTRTVDPGTCRAVCFAEFHLRWHAMPWSAGSSGEGARISPRQHGGPTRGRSRSWQPGMGTGAGPAAPASGPPHSTTHRTTPPHASAPPCPPRPPFTAPDTAAEHGRGRVGHGTRLRPVSLQFPRRATSCGLLACLAMQCRRSLVLASSVRQAWYKRQ